jgi:chemotaxis protein MotD
VTVASDNSVASIFRPVSAPRTKAESSKSEGTGSFGMMLDQSTKGQSATARARAEAHAAHADRAPARPTRRDEARPATDAPKATETKTAPKADAAEDVQATEAEATATQSNAKTAENRANTKDISQDAGAAADASDTASGPQAANAKTAEAEPTVALQMQTAPELLIEEPAEPQALQNALAQTGAVVAETTGEATDPVEGDDKPVSADASQDSETAADAAPVIPVPVVTDPGQPVAVVAAITIASDAPVTPTDAPEGDAAPIESAKAPAPQLNAGTAAQAPADAAAAAPTTAPTTDATAPAVAQPATEIEVDTTSAAAPETKPPVKADGAPDALAQAKATVANDVTADETPVAEFDVPPQVDIDTATLAKGDIKAEPKVDAKGETAAQPKAEAKQEAKAETVTPAKPVVAEAKVAAETPVEPTVKFSDDSSSPAPESKDARHTETHAASREVAADQPAKPADTTLATVKAAFDAVQNLSSATPTHAAPAPLLHINAATAATATAAIANNVQPNAVPIDGVAVEIAAQSLNGKNSFQIRLDPAELGRIDVKLEVDKDGNVSTSLMVDRPETLDLLKRDAANIERTLQQAGLKTSDNSLQFSLRDQQSFSNGSQNDRNGANGQTARLVLPDDDGAPLEAVRNNYGRLLGLGRGVDIRI